MAARSANDFRQGRDGGERACQHQARVRRGGDFLPNESAGLVSGRSALHARCAHSVCKENGGAPMILAGLLLGYCTLLCGGFGITVLLMRGASRLNLVECSCLAWLFGIGLVSLLLWLLGMFCSG